MSVEPGQVTVDSAGRRRCWWCGDTPDYCAYHDNEWGQPSSDDGRLFEKVCLEGFQAGLSWLTILRKRDNFRVAFRAFDVDVIATFNESHVEELLQDRGIVRHRGKIESVLNNARQALRVRDEFGTLGAYLWKFEPDAARSFDVQRTQSPESVAMSRDLKRRGWSFVGPTTAYAFMQSVGMVNDHVPECDSHAQVDRARREFERPR